MKKRIVCLIMALCLFASVFCIGAAAATAQQNQTAKALNHLGLFLGTGNGYALNNELTRDQGITMLVRMLGKEQEAKDGTFSHPFTDMTEWATAYVSYAYANNLTKGVSATKFNGKGTMSKQMFVTITLRALGYSDSAGGDFEYAKAISFAKEKGLVTELKADKSYLRGQAVEVFWAALNTKLKDSTQTLADKLISENVFTKKAFDEAVEIQKTITYSSHTATVEIDPNLQPKDTDTTKPATNLKMSWSDYQALSSEEKTAFYKSFASAAEFNAWRTAAQDAEKPQTVTIDQGAVITFN